ncbi:TPA: molecular chaperone [Kluyvera ascorbata]|uniref:fimbrial biogenesis chaperone n=1 Tax=Kluyvera sp. CRP TaxID=2873269 RepID=UPI0013D5016D|nr:molecular chaperone [Kluyvera sp. CRP]UAK22625.1 molecular chaperone [Kluyvera sp. CRP]HCR3983774.1 molecular chaperone [Kluyvera ascorbata]
MTPMKGLLWLLLTLSFTSQAAVSPDRTRVIFNGDNKAASLKLTNASKDLPYLAYSWIEDEKGNKSDAFFAALPPMQRLEPGAMTQVRIIKQSGVSTLPTDRESLFYYNVREIPPAPDTAENHAVVQVAMQSKIKMFWRPASLKKKPGDQKEHAMTFRLNGKTLEVQNPTPYYITLAYFGKDLRGVTAGFKTTMLPPFGSASLNTGPNDGPSFYIGYMDDYGALRMLQLSCRSSCTATASEEKK